MTAIRPAAVLLLLTVLAGCHDRPTDQARLANRITADNRDQSIHISAAEARCYATAITTYIRPRKIDSATVINGTLHFGGPDIPLKHRRQAHNLMITLARCTKMR